MCGSKPKATAPAPELPPEDPVVIEQKEENKKKKSKNSGTSSLRIDKTISTGSSGTGLNIPQ